MFDKIFKTIITILLFIVIFLLWMGLDVVDENPNVVSIEYECYNLDEYDRVPKEVVEECRKRMKNGN